MQSILALYMGKVFGFSVAMVGTIYTGMGVIIFLNQTFLLRNFWLRFFRESALEIWPFLSNTICLLLMMVPSIPFLVSGIVLYVFSQSLLRVVVASRAAGIAGDRRRGEVLGIMASVLSAAMIGGPLLAGALFDIRPFLPFAACSAAFASGFITMKFFSPKTAGVEE
jgi:DHA1 family multidrug resistance protein-like MFS transporter